MSTVEGNELVCVAVNSFNDVVQNYPGFSNMYV